jgi:hypothetical protein
MDEPGEALCSRLMHNLCTGASAVVGDDHRRVEPRRREKADLDELTDDELTSIAAEGRRIAASLDAEGALDGQPERGPRATYATRCELPSTDALSS